MVWISKKEVKGPTTVVKKDRSIIKYGGGLFYNIKLASATCLLLDSMYNYYIFYSIVFFIIVISRLIFFIIYYYYLLLFFCSYVMFLLSQN